MTTGVAADGSAADERADEPGAPAGLWLRAAAWTIDFVTCVVPAYAALSVAALSHAPRQESLLGAGRNTNPVPGWTGWGILIGSGVLVLAYFGALNRQTLGMYAVGIEVRDARTGAPVGHLRSLARILLRLGFYALIVPGPAGDLLTLVTRRQRNLVDLVARTVVVRTARSTRPAAPANPVLVPGASEVPVAGIPAVEPPEPTRPAAWYPDPWHDRRHRWWDGDAWTWQVSAGEVVEWDPPPEPRAEPLSPGVRGVGLALAGFAAGVGLSLGAEAVLWALGRPGGVVVRLVVAEAGLWSGLLGACLLVSRRRGSGRLSQDFDLRARPVDLAIGLAGSLVGRTVSVVAVIPFSAFLLHHAQRTPEQRTFGYFARGAWGWAALALVTCVGAPVVEELFFRGLIQTRLVARWGPVTGIAVTSGLFGAAHLIGWVGPISLLYAWSIAAAGIVLGTVRHLTGRLGTSMMTHGLFNAQALVILALLGATGH